MLDGWYCRSMADAAAAAEEEEEAVEESKCKKQYKLLKRKLKDLVYENECFHEALKAAQKRLLVVTRDRSFLLDRLLQLEKVESSSESEETESSEEEQVKPELVKKRKSEHSTTSHSSGTPTMKRKRISQIRPSHRQQHLSNSFLQLPSSSIASSSGFLSDGHMTSEEVERHLQSRQTYVELMPERAPLTVPTELFSNEPSLDSESNDVGETSPSNIDEDLSIDMIND